MSREDLLRVVTGLTLSIHAEELKLSKISASLGVEATDGFEKGDPVFSRRSPATAQGRYKRHRTFGMWHYCTAAHLRSACILQHTRLLIATFSPCREELQRLIDDPAYYVKLTAWIVDDSFWFPTPLLRELSRFAEEIYFVCWDESEADGP